MINTSIISNNHAGPIENPALPECTPVPAGTYSYAASSVNSGGGLKIYGGDLDNNIISGNTAPIGGGIAALSNHTQIINCIIENNEVTHQPSNTSGLTLQGAGIYAGGGASVEIHDTTIQNNNIATETASTPTNYRGGAISALSSTISSGNITVLNNTPNTISLYQSEMSANAQLEGGAIETFSGNSSLITHDDFLFTGDSLKMEGGVVQIPAESWTKNPPIQTTGELSKNMSLLDTSMGGFGESELGDTIPLLSGQLSDTFEAVVLPSENLLDGLGLSLVETSNGKTGTVSLEVISTEETLIEQEGFGDLDGTTLDAARLPAYNPYDRLGNGGDELAILQDDGMSKKVQILKRNPDAEGPPLVVKAATGDLGTAVSLFVGDLGEEEGTDDEGDPLPEDQDIVLAGGTSGDITLLNYNPYARDGDSFESTSINVCNDCSTTCIAIADLDGVAPKDFVVGIDKNNRTSPDGYQFVIRNGNTTELGAFLPTSLIDFSSGEGDDLSGDPPVDIEIIPSPETDSPLDGFVGVTAYGQLGSGYNPYSRGNAQYQPIQRIFYPSTTHVVPLSGARIKLGELHNDSSIDIVMTMPQEGNIVVAIGNSDSSTGFNEPITIPTGQPIFDVEIIDADDDGDNDIVATTPAYNPYDRLNDENPEEDLQTMTLIRKCPENGVYDIKTVTTETKPGLLVQANIDGDDSRKIIPFDLGSGYNPYDRSQRRGTFTEGTFEIFDVGYNPFGGSYCGDGVCDTGEECYDDCGSICGDNICEDGEECEADCDENTTCPGDANNDGTVDTLDLLEIIANFGSPGPDGDVNNDSSVDTLDLLEIIGNFGTTCP